MKILVLNPNSSAKITGKIAAAASALQTGTLETIIECTDGSPTEIVTAADELIAGYEVLKRLKKEDFDTAVIACFADPGLAAVRDTIKKPVVGLLESSVYFAKLAGIRYSVIASGDHRDISPWIRSLRMIGEAENLASVHTLGSTVEAAADASAEELGALVEECVKEGADSVILGCAAFAGLGETLSAQYQIPVIDGIKEAVCLAEMLCRYKT